MSIDKQVVSDFLAGDQEAFRKVYETTKKTIYTVVYRMTGNQQDTEDIMHDVYVRAYEKRTAYCREKSALATWLYRMAVNYTINFLRHKKRWSNNAVIEEGTEDLSVRTGNKELALALLAKINPDFRACLILREIEERPYTEIAGILNISIGTVRSRLNRGRKELKHLFKEISGR